MIGSDYVLEAHNIYHSSEVDSGGCLSGEGNSTLLLKGVNLTLHSGEVMAILGSKGSGKRALLDVISRRAEGSTRGQVLLNGSPLTKVTFQQRCGYVTQSCDFIPSLTVSQTLHYTPTKLNGYMKGSKVRQVLADLALSQVANRKVQYLNINEKRRLAIGVQLIRDPIMLLLDEPTHDLDPLSAYLLISILSNYAKKAGCGILLSLEKPRSDVFPFLDRALFLCLGGVVYSGGTRAMLEYFHAIGFPCPQLENPLMYYLCLSTVDRRSRDRFIESSQQIDALVERFARETPLPESTQNENGKVPLAYGKPSELSVWGVLYVKMLASIFSCCKDGFKNIFLRLFTLPIAMAFMWIFYSNVGDDSRGYFSKNGMVLNILGLSYASGILTAISLFPIWKKKFHQENSEGLYSGATLLTVYNSVSMPFSIISAAIATVVLYPITLDVYTPNGIAFMYICIGIWTSFILAEQLCITLLYVMTSKMNVSITISYILCLCLTLASGTVRSHKGLQSWLQENTKIIHTRYASLLLHNSIFLTQPSNCMPGTNLVCPSPEDFLNDRLGRTDSQENLDIGIALGIVFVLTLFNIILYLIPVSKCIQRKLKD